MMDFLRARKEGPDQSVGNAVDESRESRCRVGAECLEHEPDGDQDEDPVNGVA